MSLAANFSHLSGKMQHRNLCNLQLQRRSKSTTTIEVTVYFEKNEVKISSFRTKSPGNGEYYANFPKTFHPIAFSKFCFRQPSLELQGFILGTPDFLVFSFFFPWKKPQNVSLLPDMDQQIDQTAIQVVWFLKCYWFNMLPSNSNLHYWSAWAGNITNVLRFPFIFLRLLKSEQDPLVANQRLRNYSVA